MALSRTDRGAYGAGATAWSSSSNTQVVTPSFTPNANSLLTFAYAGFYGAAVTLANFTISGGGLTWQEEIAFQTASGDGYVIASKVWRAAVGASPSSMQVTVNHPSQSNADLRNARMGQAFDYTGYDETTPIGAKITGVNLGSGAVNLTLPSAPAASSEVLAGCVNAPNGGALLTATPASGWSERYDQGLAGYSHMQTQTRDGSTSTAVQWDDVAVGDTVYSNDSMAWAMEIRAAAIAAAARFHAQIIG